MLKSLCLLLAQMIWNIVYIILQSLLKDGYGENYILNFLSVDVKYSVNLYWLHSVSSK